MNPNPIYKSPTGEQQVMAIYDQILDRWPVPYQSLRLPTRHGETHLVASGDPSAPALILLHGACSNGLSWIGDVPVYCPHFRVYAADLPGEPGRSAPDRPAWDGPGFAEWLEDVLNGLGLRRTSLAGISQGGWTALKFATAHPERVEKLVLLTPGGVAPTRPSFIARALFLSLFGRWGAERINRITLGSTPVHPAAQHYMNVIMTNFKPRIGPQYLFSDAELARLSMPVLLVIGDQDALTPTDRVAARLRRLLPHLTVRLLPDAGHALVNLAGEILPFLTFSTDA